ncbi:MAG TPA: ASCH domain-containing protein [Dehalococcoidia bacterium]
MVAFRREDRERVARGEITVTFRLWRSAHVKAGKAYPTGFGTVEVEDVRVIPAALVGTDDVPPSGCESVEAIWALAGEHTQTTVTPDTLLHRVQFRFLGDVAPTFSAPAEMSPEAIAARLARMDARSARGAWTLRTLRLIESGPGVPARLLAADMGYETLEFKANVRKLKALGLTISHEVGYEVSELGRRYLTSVR